MTIDGASRASAAGNCRHRCRALPRDAMRCTLRVPACTSRARRDRVPAARATDRRMARSRQPVASGDVTDVDDDVIEPEATGGVEPPVSPPSISSGSNATSRVWPPHWHASTTVPTGPTRSPANHSSPSCSSSIRLPAATPEPAVKKTSQVASLATLVALAAGLAAAAAKGARRGGRIAAHEPLQP